MPPKKLITSLLESIQRQIHDDPNFFLGKTLQSLLLLPMQFYQHCLMRHHNIDDSSNYPEGLSKWFSVKGSEEEQYLQTTFAQTARIELCVSTIIQEDITGSLNFYIKAQREPLLIIYLRSNPNGINYTGYVYQGVGYLPSV